ncbi:hypothetical protein IFM89_018139 [Coptis chinensis]|uniref:Uncharacterized protein n=1 Tax=Coptis chinensis TaxID=261450 RepID=A0A835HYM0_9MAGN|nr:hypothetical protein IFM89_018139 [Coptis chinensis]
MGSAVSKAANGIGSLIGNAFTAPIKTIFGGSCENMGHSLFHPESVCFKYREIGAALMFSYLLLKLGLIQCIVRSLCKMGWAACETYCLAMEDITCFLWHKLKNTKRVHRGRRHLKDVEEGYSSTEGDELSSYYGGRNVIRRRRSTRERRKAWMWRSLHPMSYRSKDRYSSRGHHHDVHLKTNEVSVHLKGGHRRNSRQLQVRRGGNFKLYKRRIKR